MLYHPTKLSMAETNTGTSSVNTVPLNMAIRP